MGGNLTRPKQLKEFLAALKALRVEDVSWELETLLAIKEWALAQIGIDYTVGSLVVIKDGFEITREDHGWWSCRGCLVPGAFATVRAIDFNAVHKYWYADIVLKKETWTREDGVCGGEVTAKHSFSFDATQLQLGAADG